MTTNEAARQALIDLAQFTPEWVEERDMSATIHYCRCCDAYARRSATGEIIGRHADGCKLFAALTLARALK